MVYSLGSAIETPFYMPQGVTEFLALGCDSFIGIVDDTTVLKYPRDPGDRTTLEIEAECLRRIGPFKYIVALKGQREDGVLLERASHGSVGQYLQVNEPSFRQRLTWMRQATEALAVTHRAGVIHCDVNVNNLLLDNTLTIKLCDFQGRILRSDGSVEKYGFAAENIKSYMPRAEPDHADRRTDIFALASAFYFIMTSHEPFPELDSYSQEDEITERFKSSQFPDVEPPWIRKIIHSCWTGIYESADSVLQDLGKGKE